LPADVLDPLHRADADAELGGNLVDALAANLHRRLDALRRRWVNLPPTECLALLVPCARAPAMPALMRRQDAALPGCKRRLSVRFPLRRTVTHTARVGSMAGVLAGRSRHRRLTLPREHVAHGKDGRQDHGGGKESAEQGAGTSNSREGAFDTMPRTETG
jgi:hypothetical protein